MLEVVNVVASGSLGLELDLDTISTELSDLVNYNPGEYPGAYCRLRDSAPLITLYRTGKYIITGAGSEEEVRTIREEFLTLLCDREIIPSSEDDWFRLQNYVCMAEIGENVNLSALAIGLGLEVIEYEPEQFPGLVYRPAEHECVLLVFGSGEVVITGAKTIPAAENAFNLLDQQISDLF
jgi:transcription initiation factor TFIID TATA-box-binding protein